jgi:hypothetical protein
VQKVIIDAVREEGHDSNAGNHDKPRDASIKPVTLGTPGARLPKTIKNTAESNRTL